MRLLSSGLKPPLWSLSSANYASDPEDYLKKGFDFDKKVRVEYANIHTVKGLTYDNVIVDETITKKDFYFTSLRLKYTAYSRGIFDYWRLAKMSGKKYFTIGKKNECL